jgi:hypothetical protein
MASQTVSSDRAALSRSQCLILAKSCSMGFRSGEYLGRKKSLAPAARMDRRTALPLCEPRLMGWTPPHGIVVCQSGVVDHHLNGGVHVGS